MNYLGLGGCNKPEEGWLVSWSGVALQCEPVRVSRPVPAGTHMHINTHSKSVAKGSMRGRLH